MSDLPGSDGSEVSAVTVSTRPTSDEGEGQSAEGSGPPIEDNSSPSDGLGGEILTSEWHEELGFASLEDEERFFNSPYVTKKLQETGRLKARQYGNLATQAARQYRALETQQAEALVRLSEMPAEARKNLNSEVVLPVRKMEAQRILGVIRADPDVQNADAEDFAVVDPIFNSNDPRQALALYGELKKRIGAREGLAGGSEDARRRAAFEERRAAAKARAGTVAGKTPESSAASRGRSSAPPGKSEKSSKYKSAAEVAAAYHAGEIDDSEGRQLMEAYRTG